MKTSSGPLTMISVTVGSASSGSSTPSPIASSITRRISRVRSAVESTGPSRETIRPTTRSRRARRCGSRQLGELGEVDLLEQPLAVVGDAVAVAGPVGAAPESSPAMRSRRPISPRDSARCVVAEGHGLRAPLRDAVASVVKTPGITIGMRTVTVARSPSILIFSMFLRSGLGERVARRLLRVAPARPRRGWRSAPRWRPGVASTRRADLPHDQRRPAAARPSCP